ncbi:MAG: hypothetical protein R3E08_01245 [Thiotrichaceae bacterium]
MCSHGDGVGLEMMVIYGAARDVVRAGGNMATRRAFASLKLLGGKKPVVNCGEVL